MIYAPVIIPTLNRYEHFKRCIESLARNSWAQYTEVYVSVDYPPEEKYIEGHGKIVEYLNNREFKEFKMLHLFFQESNLGVTDNKSFLYNKAFERYDRMISFEDDLEVSPNYLEFINNALEAGIKEGNIYCVCGFSGRIKMPAGMTGTAFKVQAQGATYGRGVYRDQDLKIREEVSVDWLDDIVYNGRKMFKIFLKSKLTFHLLLNGYMINRLPVFFDKDGKLLPIDIVGDVYMIVNDMYSIVPTVSKVRNWGMDGSGQNCGINAAIAPENQEFDTEEKIDFKLETNRLINMLIAHRWHWVFKKTTGESRRVLVKEWLYYCYLLIRKKITIISNA